MCTDDFGIYGPEDDSSNPEPPEPEASEGGRTNSDSAFNQTWDRRSFLKAAALGTAAAALFGRGKDGWNLGGLSASAHNPTGVNCRANDVRIDGVGRILNEPCESAPGQTFTAQVVIPIFNNTNADRYCATLHLCPTMINGMLFDPGDIIIPGVVSPGTHDYTFEIPNYPANSGLVCFGEFIEDGRTSCPDGVDCCTIVSWNTSAQHECAPDLDPTPSKCRLQQICIQGFGASLECTDSCTGGACGSATDCSVACGDDLYLCASASGATAGATAGSYHFKIFDPDNMLVADSGGLVSSPQCFTISNPKVGTYTLQATDSEGCVREESVDVTVEAVTTTLDVAGHDACNDGVLTFTAGTAEGVASCSFEWVIDGVTQSETGNTLIYYPCSSGGAGINTGNVIVTATAVCGDCAAESASISFSQCVETTLVT